MTKVLINKFEVNALYYARVTSDDKVEFYRPRTMEDFENQPADWPYRVTQFGGPKRKVECSYGDNSLVMAYITPREVVRHFHDNIRWYADTAKLVEEAV